MKQYFNCACGSNDHLVVVEAEPYHGGPGGDFVLSVSPNHFQPFWKRLKLGFQYILGKKTSDYFFVDVLLRLEDVERLKNISEQYLKDCEYYS